MIRHLATVRRTLAEVLPTVAVLAASFATVVATGIAVAQQSSQNVLVVVLDDVGVDGLSCYAAGSAPPPTPNLDALAARGVRFTRAHACPTCSPSRACIQTGRYPFRTSIGEPLGPDASGLATSEVLLPEVLAGTGRPRALFGKWHLGEGPDPAESAQRLRPNTSGWPYFAGTLGGALDDYFHFTTITNGAPATVNAYATVRTVDDTLTWIGGRSSPWLALVCFNAAHTPLHDPPALLHTYALSGLDPTDPADDVLFWKAMVQAMDSEIGRLLAGLGPSTLAATTVIVVGDNGTQGNVTEPPFASDHGKGTLYEGGIRVPLLVAGPAVAGPPRTCDALVDVVDLFPTVSALCGVDARAVVPAATALDGVDLRPLLDGSAAAVREWSYSEQFGDSATLADGQTIQGPRFKLIRYGAAAEELYDLIADPLETTDLLASTPSPAALQAYAGLRVALARLREEGSVGSYGVGCAGSAGVPVLTATGAPRLAQLHHVVVSPTATTAVAALGVLGFTLDVGGGMPLPMELAAAGLPGCWLLVRQDTIVVVPGGAATATWSLPVPATPALRGVPFFQQMVVLEPGVGALGMAFSDALASVIGP